MKRILKAFLFDFLFWMALFAFYRLVFIIYFSSYIKESGFFEIIASFWYALKLDLSTASYVLIIPFIILFVQSLWSPKWINWIRKIYTLLVVTFYSGICFTELGIYAEWRTKMSIKALMIAAHPMEVIESAGWGKFSLLILGIIVFVSVLFFIYNKFFFVAIEKQKRSFVFSIVFFLVTPILLFVGLRGGLQPIPITQSQSYYSKNDVLNLSAVNSLWNLMQSIFDNKVYMGHNPYKFLPKEDAEKIVHDLYSVPKDTTVHILTTDRPNIVFLLLESWSADLIESLGARPGITPNFKNLEKEGILFTNTISSGRRTDQAMSAIFGGFPAQPMVSITKQPDKCIKLPSLNRLLKKNGYNTSFIFGGQLIYGNIKSYIIDNGFEKIIELSDFSSEGIIKGELGVHDEFVLNRQIKELANEKQPFFSFLLTLTSHSPYDQPMEDVIKWGTHEDKYLNSCYYTDKCLGSYFEKVKNQKWYNNTLFILIGDHSHSSYKEWGYFTPDNHHVPFMLFGNVIKKEFRGTIITHLCSHFDIANTLLHQLNIKSDEFSWSRNILNPYTQDFAYFEADNGPGWVRPAGSYYVYDWITKEYKYNEIGITQNADKMKKEGRAFMQVLFQQYLDY